jgi:uncharacterized protein YecT (DUF1311 family)
MSPRATFLLGLLAATLLPAGEQTAFSPDYQRCLDRSGGVTVAIRQCSADELRYQDQRLNRYYQRLMARLSPAQKKELRNAQRLWIRYRDANCGFYVGLTGGTMDLVMADDCRVEMTARRATELRDLLEMVGG